MWSLAAATRDMMVRNRLRTAQFNKTYLAFQVGILKFFAPYRTGAEAWAYHTEPTQSLTSGYQRYRPCQNRLSDLEDDTSSNNDDLWAEGAFRTTEIPRKDIFMSIVQALFNLGPLNSTAMITRPLAVVGDAFRVKIVTSFWRVERNTPPFFNYGLTVKGLAGLPRVMLRENKFTEVDIRLAVDGEDIANGMIQRRSMDALVESNVTANISLS